MTAEWPGRIVLTSPYWRLSGANVFSQYLARGLAELNIPAEILLTWPHAHTDQRMEIPTDVPFRRLPVEPDTTWRDRCRTLIDYLEEQAPCIYVPNHDYQLSAVSSQLDDSVGVVGVLHSDDPDHYDHYERLGKFWNRTVAVSQRIESRARQLHPELSDRMEIIPHGVEIPPYSGATRFDKFPLVLIYAGRISQHQKRVFDLIEIARKLSNTRVSFYLDVIGTGADEQSFRKKASELIESGIIRMFGQLSPDEVLNRFTTSDLFLMTSAFEGGPFTLLEAAARGCVPLITDIESNATQFIKHGYNGYRFDVGDVDAFSQCIQRLADEPSELKTVSRKVYDSLRTEGFTLERMAKDYAFVFREVFEDIEQEEFERPEGRLKPPPDLDLSWKQHLPTWVRRWGSTVKQWLSVPGFEA